MEKLQKLFNLILCIKKQLQPKHTILARWLILKTSKVAAVRIALMKVI